MTPNSYKIISDCVQNGIIEGWNKAYKHGKPSDEVLKNQIEYYVLLNIGENFIFEEKALDRL